MQIFRDLAQDLSQLFPRNSSKLWYTLLAAILLQIAFWYLATPGPNLISFEPRNFRSAITSVAWSILLLWFVPKILTGPLGLTRKRLGLALGDYQAGSIIVFFGGGLALVLMRLASADPAIQATYPWPGSSAGSSLQALVIWAGFYILYYASFEFFYRGFLLRTLERALGLIPAIWLQAFAATVVHFGKPFAETIAAFPASLLFAVIAVRTKSLFYPVALHFIVGISIDIFSLDRKGQLFP